MYYALTYTLTDNFAARVAARSAQDIEFGRLHARERHVSGRTRSALIRPRGLAATVRSRRAGIGGITRERRVRSTFGNLASNPSLFSTLLLLYTVHFITRDAYRNVYSPSAHFQPLSHWQLLLQRHMESTLSYPAHSQALSPTQCLSNYHC